jgi:N,N'-diacetyllegionaminate synthase
MQSVRLAERFVGPGEPCFVIAEAGVNHNGDPALARKLVDAAAAAGADAVKFQTWLTDELVAPDAPTATYQRRLGSAETQYELLKALELRHEDFRELQRHAAARGIVFLSTPDEERSADFIDELGVPAFKIGSPEIRNLPFLRYVAGKQRPVVLSTGMADLVDVQRAVNAIEEAGNRDLVLLQCVSTYPADPADANLRAMETLADAFGYPVGFSDHTLGFEVAAAAVARGACVLEKHLTLDRSLAGPDHSASLDPETFGELVRIVRIVETALGSGDKRPAASEADARAALEKKIVTRRPISAGETFVEDALTSRRAAGGLPIGELARVVGRRSARPLAEYEVVTSEALE